jgi:predicted nucleic acid-binding Zn ribbon protein
MIPVRDWKCVECGIVSNDVPTNVPDQWCPFCGKPMEKIWSVPTVLFRGGDWTPRFHNVGKAT